MISEYETYSQLTVASLYDELVRVREFIHSNAIDFGFDPSVANKLALAVDETCTNLIKHAYKHDSHKNIKISIEKEKETFIIIIKDKAEPFNLKDTPHVDFIDYFKKMKSGGLGIQLIKMIIDEIDYIPGDINNPENTLIFKKKLK